MIMFSLSCFSIRCLALRLVNVRWNVCVCVGGVESQAWGRGDGFHLSEFSWILMWRKKIRNLHRFSSREGVMVGTF